MSDGRRRVVVTGLGIVSPCGLTTEETWDGVRNGRSGVAKVEGVDMPAGTIDIAGQVKGFGPERWMDRRTVRKTDRFAQLAVAAATMAVEDAGIDIAADAPRIGCSIGTGIGGLSTQEVAHAKLFEAGPARLSPFWVTALIANMGAAEVSMALGTRGPLTTECTACAASGMSLGNALLYIRAGMADAMLAGGVEAPVVQLALGGFGTMRALSRRVDDPEGASRPFDSGRDGFVLSEGGAVLVLEELERARARGARIIGELLGYGMSSDAHHVTEPDPVGTNPARAMTMAMGDAGVTPADVGYINAHGTSTPAGDSAETRALKLALGEERAYEVPVSSTKGATGHMLGAAGAVEAAFTLLAMRDGFLPPTINLTDPDPECDLDYVPNEGRAAEIDVAISNSFGFGGHNAVLVMRRWHED
jgi:3-oxoacyl-[acyl-carrier-protein] synthase II